jgi:hypothetical protein
MRKKEDYREYARRSEFSKECTYESKLDSSLNRGRSKIQGKEKVQDFFGVD